MLEIPIFTLTNFTKLPVLRYFGTCNILHIWHIRAIPTYRVYRLYDNIIIMGQVDLTETDENGNENERENENEKGNGRQEGYKFGIGRRPYKHTI